MPCTTTDELRRAAQTALRLAAIMPTAAEDLWAILNEYELRWVDKLTTAAEAFNQAAGNA